MKKIIISTIATLSITLTAQASEWELLPILNENHKLNPSLAVLTGAINSTDLDAEVIYGLELALDCPLLKVPGGKIRQQIHLTKNDDNVLERIQLTLNPHYQFFTSDAVTIGSGPSFGLTHLKTNLDEDTIFTYGVGANIRLNVTEELFFGANVNYEATQEATLSGIANNNNNIKYFAKMGYQF